MNPLQNGQAIEINDRGLLLVKGPDAKRFLQGQVTNDIDILNIDNNASATTLGAHCTHKGRMLFSFRACALDHETIALTMYKGLMTTALDALGKYIVFSKAELIDLSEEYQFIGFSKESQVSKYFTRLPSRCNQALHLQNGIVIAITENRFEAWLTKKQAQTLALSLSQKLEYWVDANIGDGIGEVRLETSDTFIPQMLNLQALGDGISFNKGCYTGQEVVARMAYLGKLKRHMHPFTVLDEPLSPALLLPGSSLYMPDNSQSIGNVVISAKTGAQYRLLAVVTNDALNSDAIYLDPECQYRVRALPLPYAITKE